MVLTNQADRLKLQTNSMQDAVKTAWAADGKLGKI